MNKKSAWTMAELAIAITILMILAAVGVNTFKNVAQDNRMIIYSIMRNIEKVNAGMIEKYPNYLTEVNVNDRVDDNLKDSSGNYLDPYCMYFADIASYYSITNCDRISSTANYTSGKMTLSNGAIIYGLSTAFIKGTYSSPAGATVDSISIKHMMFDINGDKNPNKIWVDRFPIDVYGGLYYPGIVRVSDCSNSSITAYQGNYSYTYSKNPYCADSTVNYRQDSNYITYDVYVPQDDSEKSKVKLVKGSLSTNEADCAAYAGTVGLVSKTECNSFGYHLAKKCATSDTCTECSSGSMNICPVDSAYNSSSNCLAKKQDRDCIVLIHKPSLITSILLKSISDDIQDE